MFFKQLLITGLLALPALAQFDVLEHLGRRDVDLKERDYDDHDLYARGYDEFDLDARDYDDHDLAARELNDMHLVARWLEARAYSNLAKSAMMKSTANAENNRVLSSSSAGMAAAQRGDGAGAYRAMAQTQQHTANRDHANARASRLRSS